MVCDRDLSHHMGEDETRVQAAEGHTQLGILAQTEKKEGSITYPLSTQPSRGQVVNYVPFLGLRVCHTDLERKEKTHRRLTVHTSQGAADSRLRSQQPTENTFHLLCRDWMGPRTLGSAYTDTGWNRD